MVNRRILGLLGLVGAGVLLCQGLWRLRRLVREVPRRQTHERMRRRLSGLRQGLSGYARTRGTL